MLGQHHRDALPTKVVTVRPIFLLAAALFASVLAGCTGSGGSMSIGAPTVGAAPIPDSHPAPDGAVVTFTVDETDTDQPTDGQTKTTSTSVTQTATLHTGAMFDGNAAIDVHTASSDGNYVQDNYEAFVPTQAGQNFELIGKTDSFAKQQLTEVYKKVALIIDEIPEVTGAHWNSSVSLNYTGSRGPTSKHVDETDVRNADSSEVDTLTYSDGNPADTETDTFTTNADGTGNVTQKVAAGTSRVTVGVPVQQNGTFVIPETYTDTSGATQSYTVADWYPGHALPPQPLNTDMTADLGVGLPPAACSKGPQVQAAHLRRTEMLLATIGGTAETVAENDYFAPARGLICSVIDDTRSLYDWTGTGAVTDVRTSHIVYSLTSGIGILSNGRRLDALSAPLGIPVDALRLRHFSGPPRRGLSAWAR